MNSLLVLAALGIIGVLGAIALYYLSRLYLVNKKQQLLQRQRKEDAEKKIRHSIYILAKSLLAEQVPIAEAALRISALAEGLEIAENEKWLYVSFQKLAQAISHIPILENWKKLTKPERQQYREQIAAEENKYKEFILKAASGLVEKDAS